MNTKLLKQKILDLAIRGKLTQQLKSDGTAADLLKEISSASHPERSAKGAKSKDPGTIIPLDKNEAPFEVPANWEWVRLGDVGKWQSGTTPSKSNSAYYKDGTIPWLNTGDLNDGIINNIPKRVTEKALAETSLRLNEAGSVCIAMYGATIGKLGILSMPATTNQACCVCNNLKSFVNRMWLFFFLMNHKQEFIEAGFGGAQPNISKEKIVSTMFPLPPLAEQQRIVEKIQEAFAEIDSIENNKELLKTHIKQARQKILDLAIHGKLVPQNKSDEPASVLLERITRDNPHYEKLTDVPFEIPESWEWVKLGDVCKPIKRGKSPKYIEQSNVLVFAQKCNQKDGPVSLEKALYLDESTLNKYPKEEFLQKGDVIINSTGSGTLGRVGYFNVDLPQGIKGIVPDSHVTTIRSSVVNSNYLYSYLKNKQSYLEKNGEGSTNQKELKPHTIYDLEFPLPPLAEQKRIVNKIDEIFASLDEISLHLV